MLQQPSQRQDTMDFLSRNIPPLANSPLHDPSLFLANNGGDSDVAGTVNKNNMGTEEPHRQLFHMLPVVTASMGAAAHYDCSRRQPPNTMLNQEEPNTTTNSITYPKGTLEDITIKSIQGICLEHDDGVVGTAAMAGQHGAKSTNMFTPDMAEAIVSLFRGTN